MKIVRKDATIANTGPDEDFPGSFEVILSTPAEDRDGDELLTGDWELPLPDHITFDTDHGMSVATTVGSGVPSINEKGQLVVAGTYSSLARAQEARTLVKEGHIRTTSVAFMTKAAPSTAKDGKPRKVRELLNGAFVAVPSNREALVTAAKAATGKAGARNSASDGEHIQAILDHVVALGAEVPSDSSGAAEGAVGGKAVQRRMVAAKAVAGSYEQRQQAISDALDAAYPDPPDNGYCYAYPLATFDDSVVYRVGGDTELRGQWQADYTVNDDGTVSLGEPAKVNMVEQVVPVKNYLPDPSESGQPAADVPADPAATKAAESAETPAADDAAAVLALKARTIAARAMAGAAS